MTATEAARLQGFDQTIVPKALVGASALLKDMVGNSFTSNVMLAVMLAMMPQWNRKPE